MRFALCLALLVLIPKTAFPCDPVIKPRIGDVLGVYALTRESDTLVTALVHGEGEAVADPTFTLTDSDNGVVISFLSRASLAGATRFSWLLNTKVGRVSVDDYSVDLKNAEEEAAGTAVIVSGATLQTNAVNVCDQPGTQYDSCGNPDCLESHYDHDEHWVFVGTLASNGSHELAVVEVAGAPDGEVFMHVGPFIVTPQEQRKYGFDGSLIKRDTICFRTLSIDGTGEQSSVEWSCSNPPRKLVAAPVAGSAQPPETVETKTEDTRATNTQTRGGCAATLSVWWVVGLASLLIRRVTNCGQVRNER